MNKHSTVKSLEVAEDLLFYSTLRHIEKKLKETVVSVKKMDKLYGSKSNNNTIVTVGNFGGLNKYVLKFASQDDINNEILGTQSIINYLPVPKIILFSLNEDNSWLLRDFVPGVLMTDITNHFELSEKSGRLEEMEFEKEKLIVRGYEKTNNVIGGKEYIDLTANILFHKRLTGERFKQFYLEGKVATYLDKQICLNGKTFQYTLRQMFDRISQKYSLVNNKQSLVLPSHGDAHHGNIIISDKGNIHFFDNEYSGMLPVYMDLSKPYYNDLLGALFFYFQPQLLSHFKIESVKNTPLKLNLKVKLEKEFKTRMEITKIKLKQRNKFLDNKADFLLLNDYLFLCHTLTKDPNLYPEDVKILFLALCPILCEFDTLDPESIYRYFN